MCSGNGVCDCGQCFCNRGFTGYLCNEKWGGESVLCTDTDVSNCVLCLHESLVKSFDEIDAAHTPVAGSTPAPDLYAPAYRTAAEKCADLCRDTVINVNTVKLVDSRKEQQKDDASSLCIIYPDNNCRVFFTYRYSDTIYLNRKVSEHWDHTPTTAYPRLLEGGQSPSLVAAELASWGVS